MITVHYLGELGNRLFQYSLARIIAVHTGMALRVEPVPGFPGTAEAVPGRVHRWRRRQVLTDGEFRLDALPTNRHIQLFGYFQKASLYADHPVKAWLDVEDLTTADPRDVVMHVRLGDYLRLGRAMGPAYYLEALARAAPRRVYLCTDAPDSPLLAPFLPFEPEIVRLGTLETFRFIKSFRQIILSQSTFSWWAAWLSDADRIWFPALRVHPQLDNWSNGDLVPDEGRYEVIEHVDGPVGVH